MGQRNHLPSQCPDCSPLPSALGGTEEQCAKPTGLGIISLSEEKDFYDLWESVIVTCARGYHAVSGAITCEWQGTRSDWNEPDLCIGEYRHKRVISRE
ncbi:hypothetical protein XELAEV_18004010mg [Xenopus laevis]|uniref:Sushi domain-containing protein n=1 Tax=Xenopus laevis TaxID=8355 RepID=A0A974BRW0_XENLA|nr:hypothetical protein XELAEV_18004010mg [Xenopus laevis]